RCDLVLAVTAELALRQLERGRSLAAPRFRADKRHARLQREVVGDLDETVGAGLLDRAPQVVACRVAVAMALDVPADAFAPGILAGIGLEHRDHRFALRIRDRV